MLSPHDGTSRPHILLPHAIAKNIGQRAADVNRHESVGGLAGPIEA
jgi:hypothetical protein